MTSTYCPNKDPGPEAPALYFPAFDHLKPEFFGVLEFFD
jgi:hypothetical protein